MLFESYTPRNNKSGTRDPKTNSKFAPETLGLEDYRFLLGPGLFNQRRLVLVLGRVTTSKEIEAKLRLALYTQ